MWSCTRNCPNVFQNAGTMPKSSKCSTALLKCSLVDLSNICSSGKGVGALERKPHVGTGLGDAIPQHPAKRILKNQHLIQTGY